MNQIEFKKEVEDFQKLYLDDYMRDHKIVFDFDDPDFPTAEIKCEDFFGHKWDIPICISDFDENILGIDIGSAGTLGLDGEGFYCYLWHRAVSRLEVGNYERKTIHNS